jgi:crossover junction endodeoxyribonuclease RuvC
MMAKLGSPRVELPRPDGSTRRLGLEEVVDQNAERSAGARDAAGRSPIPMLGSIGYQDSARSGAVQCPSGASVIAIDIGIRGAIALLTAKGELITAFDMPVLADGPAGRRAVNGPLLAEIVFKSHATRAFVELVGARPGEGAVGAFAFGRSRGVCEGVLAAAGIPATFIAPAAWKRAVGIPPGKEGAKDAARAEALRRWPSHAALFARVMDDGRAEAALIGVAGLLREGRHV